MFPYAAYKVLHIAGVFFLLFSLASYIVLSQNSLEKGKKLASIFHGISLFIVLLGGFGLLARLGITGSDWPAWVWMKLIVWILLGLSLYIIKKIPSISHVMWFVIPILAIISVYLAVYKPLL